MHLNAAILTLLLWAAFADVAHAEVSCVAPPAQVSQNIVVDTNNAVGKIGPVTGLQLENKVEIIANELIATYPNADKVAVAMLLLNAVCEQLKSATTLTDAEKLAAIERVSVQILVLFGMQAPAPAAPPPKEESRAFIYPKFDEDTLFFVSDDQTIIDRQKDEVKVWGISELKIKFQAGDDCENEFALNFPSAMWATSGWYDTGERIASYLHNSAYRNILSLHEFLGRRDIFGAGVNCIRHDLAIDTLFRFTFDRENDHRIIVYRLGYTTSMPLDYSSISVEEDDSSFKRIRAEFLKIYRTDDFVQSKVPGLHPIHEYDRLARALKARGVPVDLENLPR